MAVALRQGVTPTLSIGQAPSGVDQNAQGKDTEPKGAELLGAGFTVLLAQLLGGAVQETTASAAGALPAPGTPVAQPSLDADLPAPDKQPRESTAVAVRAAQAPAELPEPLPHAEDRTAPVDREAGARPPESRGQQGLALSEKAGDAFLQALKDMTGQKDETAPGTSPSPELSQDGQFDLAAQSAATTAPLSAPAASAPAAPHAAAIGHASPAAPVQSGEHTGGMAAIAPDGSRLAVTLEPDGLGRLNIDLHLDKGMINAQINVSDQQVRSLIQDRAHDIVQALVAEGISVGGFNVSFRESGSGQDQEQGPGTGGRRELSAIDEAAPAAPASSNGRISIFA